MMRVIIDYDRDNMVAIPKRNMYVITNRSQKKMRNTTFHWNLLVKWADYSESLISLKYMKEAHPVILVKFSKAHDISDNPSFECWVPYTLRKQDVILSNVKARIRKTTQKYGIEIPTNINHANRLDRENNNTLWRDTLANEITNIGIFLKYCWKASRHRLHGAIFLDIWSGI